MVARAASTGPTSENSPVVELVEAVDLVDPGDDSEGGQPLAVSDPPCRVAARYDRQSEL